MGKRLRSAKNEASIITCGNYCRTKVGENGKRGPSEQAGDGDEADERGLYGILNAFEPKS